MRLKTDLVPTSPPSGVVVVIDVLRMTTTASALFSRGLEALFVVPDPPDAQALAAREGALLLGERGGHPIAGFDGGNSPVEHAARDLTGRTAVLCTTNGSKAVGFAGPAKHVLLGSIVNARAVAERALGLTKDGVTLLCAGTLGQLSLDDVLGAACIARELVRLEPALRLDDSGTLALTLLKAQGDLYALLREAEHAKLLQALGYGEDVTFAAGLNTLQAVPQRDPRVPMRFTAS